MARNIKSPHKNQKRSWGTKEWNTKRNKVINGKVCQQCGSPDILQVHHRHTEKNLYNVMRKRVVNELIRVKMKSGEIPFKGKISREFTCPQCHHHMNVISDRYKNKTCTKCGVKSELTDNNLMVLRDYNYNLSRSEIFFFCRQFENEIDSLLKDRKAPPKPDYMNLNQDTAVLCNRCHYALENGYDLCPVCKEQFKEIGKNECNDCNVKKTNFLIKEKIR